MKDLLHAGRALAMDTVSTIVLLIVYWSTGNLLLSVAVGLVLVATQIVWQIARKKPVDTLQWISLVVVMASGAGTIHAHDPIYVMLQPSAIYLLVGGVMLKRGWMLRYLPAIAIETVSGMAIGFGYVWAGLMFVTAALNACFALLASFAVWSAFIAIFPAASKIALFAVQFLSIRHMAIQNHRARQANSQALA